MSADPAQLVLQLQSSDPATVAEAARQLAQTSFPNNTAAVSLVRCADVESEAAREWVHAALEGIGAPNAADLGAIAGELTAYLDGERGENSGYWSVTLLGRAREEAAQQVALLERCATAGEHESVRERAVWALGKIGSSASSARSTLVQLAESSSPRMARLAASALKKI